MTCGGIVTGIRGEFSTVGRWYFDATGSARGEGGEGTAAASTPDVICKNLKKERDRTARPREEKSHSVKRRRRARGDTNSPESRPWSGTYPLISLAWWFVV